MAPPIEQGYQLPLNFEMQIGRNDCWAAIFQWKSCGISQQQILNQAVTKLKSQGYTSGKQVSIKESSYLSKKLTNNEIYFIKVDSPRTQKDDYWPFNYTISTAICD